MNYARHALRCVSLWLFTLPLALLKDFKLMTAPVVMCLAWSYFGIYEIGYTIEDPFKSALRLDTLCDAIYRNVMFGTPSMRRRLAALDQKAEGETDKDWKNLPLPPVLIPTAQSLGKNASLDG
uniref:Bestrophin homolog n=1 Tax=Amphora coffeiformis TaxID=265554 RepID=A0A7S3P6M1_9STRA